MVGHPSITSGDVTRCPFHQAIQKEEELETKRSAAKKMLELGQHGHAVELLRSVAAKDSSGKTDALLGDAYFMLERYSDAERHYKAALNKDPSNEGWKDRVGHAVGNALSEVSAEIPSSTDFFKSFTRDKLLAGPDLPEIDAGLRQVIERKGLSWLMHKVKTGIGNGVGAAGNAAFHGLAKLAGATGTSDEIWTNWHKDNKLPLPQKLKDMWALLKLAHMRDELFKNNLVSTYPAGAKTAFYAGGGEPPEWVKTWRTPDGSWNHLQKDKDGKYDPMVGAAFTRFFRNVGDDKGIEATRPKKNIGANPVNPIEVSEVILKREGPMKEVPFLNMIAANWIQFMTHDWVSHGDPDRSVVDNIPIPKGHPAREKYHLDAMPIARTAPDPTRMPDEAGRPPTYLNEVTHWWDGSQIYGSDKHTQKKLRSGVDGKLKMADDGRLPQDPMTKTEVTGFNRNWWTGLSMMHTVFAREHNAICDKLKASHPDWNDEQLFQTARLVNAAVMAKIHTVEWTPAILPNRILNDGMNTNWYGLLTRLFNKKTHKKAVEDIRLKSPELGGILGGPKGKAAKYALSEEFTAVYRLHSLLPDAITIKRRDGSKKDIEVPLSQMRQAGSAKITDRVSMSDLFYSFGKQHPGQLVANNFPKTLRELSLPGSPFQDLGAIDVYRDRERGVPSFNQLRRELGLKPIKSFDDLTDDKDVAQKLRSLYGKDASGKDKVDDMDLLIGTLCEGHRPAGYGFGETLFQVFILNASWRLLGDRFFTDDYREEVYTKEGLDWVDEASMKSVLLRHFPELSGALGKINNAFEPWDEGELNPERHPLAFGGHPFSDEVKAKVAAMKPAASQG